MVALYRQRFAGPRRAICGYSGLPERGGGLVALAEDGNHQPPTAGAAPAPFGFLPFLVSSTAFEGGENGDVLTPAGANLGLTNSDINGNFSHNIFTATGGMNVVNRNAAGQILFPGFPWKRDGHRRDSGAFHYRSAWLRDGEYRPPRPPPVRLRELTEPRP
jgi:hypothetical protein